MPLRGPSVDEEVDRLNRLVEDLLADRRPNEPFFAEPKAFRARQVAALLSAARPGAGIPSRKFLTRLAAKIERGLRLRPG
jgi:hypothetical protein